MECQKICQMECQIDLPDGMPDRYARWNARRYARWNVRRSARWNARFICQMECQIDLPDGMPDRYARQFLSDGLNFSCQHWGITTEAIRHFRATPEVGSPATPLGQIQTAVLGVRTMGGKKNTHKGNPWFYHHFWGASFEWHHFVPNCTCRLISFASCLQTGFAQCPT